MPNLAGLTRRQFLVLLGGSSLLGLFLTSVLPPESKPNDKIGLNVLPDLNNNHGSASTWLRTVSPTLSTPSTTEDKFLNRAKMVEDILFKFFIEAESSEQIIAKVIDQAARLKEADSSNAEYLQELANNMQGMTVPGMQRYLNKEKRKLFDKAADHQETNAFQVKQLKGEKYRLFSAPKTPPVSNSVAPIFKK